jgi:leucine dehydrogenase
MKRLEREGFDEVYRLDCAGTPAFVSLHAVIDGRSFGGIRIRSYGSEDDALADVLALSRAMSRKVVMAGIRGGGAKAVLMQPVRERAAAVRALGEFVDSLEGRYRCGPDYGFTAADAAILAQATRYASHGDLAHSTAQTILYAMQAVRPPSVVAIQGVGAVGRHLAQMLQAKGVQVIPSDVHPVEGFELVPPDAIYDVPCDCFAPCAAGGVLDEHTIARLKAGMVCGAANNPFRTDDDAERLRARGIAYVPDFIANSGGLIQGASAMIGEEHLIAERLGAVHDLVRDIVARADREGRSPHAVAIELADERIEQLRRTRRPGISR